MKIPERDNSTINMVDDYYANKIDNHRPHMGASMIGHKCERYLWYSFRWVFKEKFEGRMLRLFDVGHDFEPKMIRDLRNIGVDIRSTQDRVDFGKHVSGSVDGIIYSGLIEAPKSKHVAEFKTHSDKSFKLLVTDGVEKSKPLHYVQMQTYMLGLEIDRAYYVAVNKNTSELYSERLELNKEVAQKYVTRAQRVAMQEGKPAPMTFDATWYECTYCPAKEMCHKAAPTKQVNCRTCAHSTPKEDSTWFCERWEDTIPYDAQLTGCDSHVFHPEMVPYEFKPYEKDEWQAIYIINNKPVINGPSGYYSTEIAANPNACAEPDAFIEDLRAITEAKIC